MNKITQAQELKKGCGIELFCMDSNWGCGTDNTYCKTCQAKISQAISCWEDEIKFLESINVYTGYNGIGINNKINERLSELKSAVGILK